MEKSAMRARISLTSEERTMQRWQEREGEHNRAPRESLFSTRRMMMSLRSSLRSVRHISQRRFMAAMPKPQSMEAELWQGHPKHEEGWETTIYVTYGVTTVLLGLTYFFSPETSIKTWANAEAQARLDLKGVELEFGKHYSDPDVKYNYDSLKAENPFNEEEEDDDEEEEEEEEEEDNDEVKEEGDDDDEDD